MWGGIDISSEMVKRAEHNCKAIDRIEFEVSGIGISSTKCFDIIYSVAVFAHIDDELTKQLFCNFADHLSEGGRLIICEQVGAKRIAGETYTRRTIDEYRNMLESIGFYIKNINLIDFWAHRILFERRIAKWFYRRMPGTTYHDRQIEANRHLLFRLCSSFFTAISIPHIFRKDNGWGYLFMVAEKPTE